jgi:membrane-bound lytic murein transglycosylase B
MQFSLRGALFSTTLIALAVLLCLPSVLRGGHQAAAGAVLDGRAGEKSIVTAGPPANSQPRWNQPLAIAPVHVSTAQPARPVAVVHEGVIGPAGDIGDLGIPTMVLSAYKLAAADLAREQPACKLPWWLLAGIGHTESGHAESGRLYADGTTRGRILGPRLNGGIAGDAVISDTDSGVYDGDSVYDRAVGPMQFIPSTWAHWGADGNHDGKRDPNNIFDATLAAGRYLCADGRNLATLPGLQAAVLSYNHSQAYLDTVLAWGFAYRSGASSLPNNTSPVVGDVTKVRPKLTARPQKAHKLITKTKTAAKPSVAASPPVTASSSSSSQPAPSSGSGSATASASPTGTCTTAAPTGSSTTAPTGHSASAGSHSASGQSAVTAQAVRPTDGGSGSLDPAARSAGVGTATATSTPTSTVTACAR